MHFGETRIRISDYHDKTRYFVTKTFDKLNYEDLISIF